MSRGTQWARRSRVLPFWESLGRRETQLVFCPESSERKACLRLAEVAFLAASIVAAVTETAARLQQPLPSRELMFQPRAGEGETEKLKMVWAKKHFSLQKCYLSHDWSGNDICVILVGFDTVHVFVQDCDLFLVVPSCWTVNKRKRWKIVKLYPIYQIVGVKIFSVAITWILRPSPQPRLVFWMEIRISGGLGTCRGHRSSCLPWPMYRRELRRSPGRISEWTAEWNRSVLPCSRNLAPDPPCSPSESWEREKV